MNKTSGSGALALSRRRLLKLGAGSGVFLALGSLARVAAAATQQLPLSIGWISGSDRWPRLRPLPWEPLPSAGHPWPEGFGANLTGMRVESAESLDGDLSLADQWLVVRIFGLYPGLAGPEVNGFRSVNLIHWQLLASQPVLVWGGRRIPGPSSGSPVSYPYQLDRTGLQFTIEEFKTPRGGKRGSETTTPAAPSRVFSGQLTVDQAGGALRRGVYLLGLEPGLWSGGGELMPPDDPLALTQSSVAFSVEALEPAS